MSDTAPASKFTPRVFSGIQPSGGLTLGNYLGAIKRFVSMQDEDFETVYCMVDLHAITVWQDPADLRHNTRELAAGFIASGISPGKIHPDQPVPSARTCATGLDFQLCRPHGLDGPHDPVQGQGRQEHRKGVSRPVSAIPP